MISMTIDGDEEDDIDGAYDDGGDRNVDDDENDDYQWLRDEESALDASTTQWTISAPDRLVVLSR